MTSSPVRSALCGAFFASFALFAVGCLNPAVAPDSPQGSILDPETETEKTSANTASPAGTTDQKSVAVVVPPPRDFTHTSMQLMAELKLGWNLGNALDAPEGETAWGNPPITPDLLRAVKNAGFSLVRIPVTWTKHMGPGPEFVIEPSFLQRVKEVVGYAHAAGLHAIINVHHDGADGFTEVEWLTLNDAGGQTTEENNALVKARYVKVWTQIAQVFAPFGEELLFESMNEIHDGYGTPDPRHITFINQLNQTFVRLVRASGGNNEKRHLVVPGYNTNIEHTVSGFQAPSDSTKDRLILSVHFYDPYLYALQAKIHTWGAASPGRDDWGQEEHVVAQFTKMKTTFVDKGMPVLMGEYGATHQSGYEDYRRYYMEYVTKAAVERGIVPVYWDNGGQTSGAESFGLFNRQSGAVLHPQMLEAMVRAARGTSSLSDIPPPSAAPAPK